MTPSEREALVVRVRKLAALVGDTNGEVHTFTGRAAVHLSADLSALCAEVERLTRERDQWMQRATDEEAAHVMSARAYSASVRDADTMHRYRVERDQARKEVTRLTAEVERLREDAARLDWLEVQTRHADGVDVNHDGELDHPGCTWQPEGYSITRTSYLRHGPDTVWLADRLPTLRAAIDAARTTGGTDA